MPKFSGKQTRPNVSAPLRTTGIIDRTHEGGIGYERDAKSELFLLAVTNMVGEQTFYESAKDRDNRFRDLTIAVAKSDPEWIQGFIPYLRNVMQMRSASVVMAAHYAAIPDVPKRRQVVDSAMSRADEPAEFLAFYAQEYGKNFPQPVKRGIADAVNRLYTEYAALKYDGQSRAWRMGDVVDLVHPKSEHDWQSALYKYLLDTRHNRDDITFASELAVIHDYTLANQMPVDRRREHMRKYGIPRGMTWESLSGWLQGPMDAEAWDAVIPQMGYMALLRNLRNFEEAGISDERATYVADFLSDPENVANSRQFPIRFYSAWKNTGTRFAWALEQALEHSVSNIPQLEGRSLVMIDVSGSMGDRLSNRSEVQRWEAAAVFGIAFAKAQKNADVVLFQSYNTEYIPVGSVLKNVDRIHNAVGGGTQTWQALRAHYAGHDRVLILTDEQAHPGAQPQLNVPLYTFNLAGYRYGHAAQGSHGSYVFGGLTDAGFNMLAMLEGYKHGSWPWQG